MRKLIIYTLGIPLVLSACKKDDKGTNQINYRIDSEVSTVGWRGYLIAGNNHGTFSVADNDVVTENGVVTGGTFTIPIASVNVLNLEGDLKTQLEDHLKSGDFFNVLIHPNAVFSINKVSKYDTNSGEDMQEGANYLVTGELTMLGKTNRVEFPAKINIDGNSLIAEALIKINRTEWGMDYASDPALEEHYILPDVDLVLDITATKN